MYAFLVADSDRDIDEPNNRNNVIMREVVVVGPNGILALHEWFIQTELEWDRDRDQEKNGLHYFMFSFHTATYVGT